jgi:hypothetical protein
MNILIKLSCLVGLTLAPLLGEHGSDSHKDQHQSSGLTQETTAPANTPATTNYVDHISE